MSKNYSVLLTTEDSKGKTLAVNIPKSDYEFLEDYLCKVGGVIRFGVSLYDDKPCHEPCDNYGKWYGRKTCMKWLAENVFFNWKNFDVEYTAMKSQWTANRRLDDMTVDILYNKFDTGTNTENMQKKIACELWNRIPDNYVEHPVSKERLTEYISEAIVATLIA